MHPDCLKSAEEVLKRDISDGEAKSLEESINRHMRLLARQDRIAWGQYSRNEQLRLAGEAAAREIIHDLQKKQQRIELNIQAMDRLGNYMAGIEGSKPGDKLQAVSRIAVSSSVEGGITSIESHAKAVSNYVFGKLLPAMEAAHPKVWGVFENPQGIRDVVKEFYGEDSGNQAAKALVKIWREVSDTELRSRFNAAGGDVGKLFNYTVPQYHDGVRIGAVGPEAWISKTIPRLDREMYLNTDGTLMSESRLHDMLLKVYDSITTNGHSDPHVPRTEGYGLVVDRNSQHRQLFFKDAQSYLDYSKEFGRENLWNTMKDYVRSMSRNIAMSEVAGPDADANLKHLNDQARLDELRAFPERAAKIKKQHYLNEAAFDYVAGRENVVDQQLADRFQAYRNITTGIKLPGVVITALGDEAGMFATSAANKIPYSAVFLNEMKAAAGNKHIRQLAREQGLGMNGALQDMNRFGSEMFDASWSSKIPGAVLKYTGAERMWDARRTGLGLVLQSKIGDLTRRYKNFSDLNDADHGMLARKGVTQDVWEVWRMAATKDEGAGLRTHLSTKAINDIPDSSLARLGNPEWLRREAITTMLAHIHEEAGMGAMDTGARERSAMFAGTARGTAIGELARSAFLFKSFAWNMMMKHWTRAASMPTAGGKAQYAAALTVYGTVIGALTLQLKDLIMGKNPENMASPAFWIKALLKSGAMGLYGDAIGEASQTGKLDPVEFAAGPIGKDAQSVAKLAAGVVDPKTEPIRLANFARQNTPFLNFWYTKAAMDHLLWHNLQEAASPGYLDKMQSRAQAQSDNPHWWDMKDNFSTDRPSDFLPKSAPDFSQAWNPDRGAQEIDNVKEKLSKGAQVIGLD